MKKLKFLTLLAVLTLLTVPAQAANRPAVRLDTGREIVRRCPRAWGRWTLPDFYCPDCAAQVPDTDAPAQTPDVSAPDTTPAPDIPAQTPDVSAPDTSTAAGMSAYETEVVRLVNVERARYGLSALAADAELSNVARLKSKDMRQKGYFSHESPTYGTPFQMMKSFGITYRTAGENIAYGYSTPEAVVTAWMNSDGHRANILNSSYTRLGVGYVADGHYWTQMFIG
ncbi:MAG: serine protease [Oscillospiraceae bacterium]|nr:serine protease [Oscillospiraceae bacterium]